MNIPKLDLHPDSAEWSEQINTYEHSMYLLTEIFDCRITGDEDTLTMLSHPDSKNKHGLSVFKDTGKMHFRTGNFDGVEKEDTLTTWDFISVAMERNPIKCAHEFKWIDASNYLDEAKEVNGTPTLLWKGVTADERREIAKKLEPSKMLIGDIIYRGEQVILFARPGTGKTILAMNMGIAIAEGKDLDLGNGVVLINECGPITTAIFDFELADQQYQKRVGDSPLPDNLIFFRKERGMVPPKEPKEVFEFLKINAESVGAKVIFVDNLKAISSDMETGDTATEFMNQLWTLAREEGMTIIIVAHSVKQKYFIPLEMEDCKGASDISALCDAMIGLGRVKSDNNSKGIYLKHLKSRNGEETYDAGAVICMTVQENVNGLVRMQSFSTVPEIVALSGEIGLENRIEWGKSAVQYLLTGSYRKAAKEVGKSHSAVKRDVEKYKARFSDEWSELEGCTNHELESKLNLLSIVVD